MSRSIILLHSTPITGFSRARRAASVARKNQDLKHEPPITEAAERAEILIRGLQSRLAERAGDVRANESSEDLAWELENYFAVETSKHVTALSPLDQIRKRVVEGVAERVLHGWEWSQEGKAPPLENEVIERLVDRVFQRLTEAHGELPEASGRTLPAAPKSPARQVLSTHTTPGRLGALSSPQIP
jgi:hypothetical protein